MTRDQIEAEFEKMFMPPKDSSFGPVIRSGDAIVFAEHIAKLAREECAKGLISQL